MRSKEFAHDYRYFPEPDLLPLIISEAWKEEVRGALPELPEARKLRFIREYALPDYDAAQLTTSKVLANYFEQTAKASGAPKLGANWILSELLYLLKEAGNDIADSPVAPTNLAELLVLIDKGTVSGKMGKDILAEMFASGKRAGEVMAEKGLEQINDAEQLATLAREIMSKNPTQVELYRKGKAATLGWFVGQMMKASRGQANPQLLQEVLKKELAG
jgi:aspartyl-tRNA(Asn)/glutamyl-tRNA(Gln) amidotransferase subunit B